MPMPDEPFSRHSGIDSSRTGTWSPPCSLLVDSYRIGGAVFPSLATRTVCDIAKISRVILDDIVDKKPLFAPPPHPPRKLQLNDSAVFVLPVASLRRILQKTPTNKLYLTSLFQSRRTVQNGQLLKVVTNEK
jgi:hypothetical protein